ncbi:hypothetical protein ACJMK2_017485 [Sinanodonta woodiana]|uniref:VWFA domain-containing protein n=1 Tax=Sinanodonta woodiana TaxID=1069815 RepID=A0ABD3UDN0_SINWO
MKGVILIVIVISCCTGVFSKLELINNGYEGLYVVIGPEVKENYSLVSKIQEIITSASRLLFKSTKQRAYIRKVTIIIPKTWSRKLAGSVISKPSSLDSEYILIDNPSSQYGRDPYVEGVVECGKPGKFMHLTPELLLMEDAEKTYGPWAHVFVHEWGHLRWGLFDEYKTVSSSSLNPYFYYEPVTQQYQPVVCTKNIKGQALMNCDTAKPCDLSDTRFPLPHECRYCPCTEGDQTAPVSLMGHSYITSLSRIAEMKRTAQYIIDVLIQASSFLGIVSFSSSATIVAQLTEITNDNDRRHLKNVIMSLTADDRTGIGRGLLKAKELFDASGKGTRESEIILITDGEENEAPYIADVTNALIKAGIVVHTISITQDAQQNLKNLAQATGGTFLAFLEKQSVSFIDVFSQVIISGDAIPDTNTPGTIISYSKSAAANENYTEQFVIDYGLGKDTMLTVMSTSSSSPVIVTVVCPDGNKTHSTITSTGTLSIACGNNGTSTMPGSYSYSLSSAGATNYNVYVTSSPRGSNADVIRARCWLSDTDVDFTSPSTIRLYADVERGRSPVLNAIVTGMLIRGNGSSVNLTLHDTGKGADLLENDGLYTTYMYKDYFTGNGRYNMKIRVFSDGGTVTYSSASGQRAPIVPCARYYEVRASDSINTLVDNFDSGTLINTSNVVPKASGETEQLIFEGTKPGSSHAEAIWYVGIRAVDRNNNKARVSNIVTLGRAASFSITDTFNVIVYPGLEHEVNTLRTTIIIVVVVVVAVLLGIVIGGLFLYRKIKRPGREDMINSGSEMQPTAPTSHLNCTRTARVTQEDTYVTSDPFKHNVSGVSNDGYSTCAELGTDGKEQMIYNVFTVSYSIVISVGILSIVEIRNSTDCHSQSDTEIRNSTDCHVTVGHRYPELDRFPRHSRTQRSGTRPIATSQSDTDITRLQISNVMCSL